MRSHQRRSAKQYDYLASGCALGVRGLPVVLAAPTYASQDELLKRKLMSKYSRKYAALALVVRQGRVDLGVCHGRGLSSARGTAKTKSLEMPVYLGAR